MACILNNEAFFHLEMDVQFVEVSFVLMLSHLYLHSLQYCVLVYHRLLLWPRENMGLSFSSPAQGNVE